MAKKQVAVTLRKPPQADVDSFIHGGAAAASSDIDFPPQPSRGLSAVPAAVVAPISPAVDEVVTTTDGRAFREMTVYLPNDLARRFSLHCMESDRDVSRVMAEILKERLDAPALVSTPVVPVAAKPFEAPKSRLTANLEMGREIALSLWRIRPWAT